MVDFFTLSISLQKVIIQGHWQDKDDQFRHHLKLIDTVVIFFLLTLLILFSTVCSLPHHRLIYITLLGDMNLNRFIIQ